MDGRAGAVYLALPWRLKAFLECSIEGPSSASSPSELSDNGDVGATGGANEEDAAGAGVDAGAELDGGGSHEDTPRDALCQNGPSSDSYRFQSSAIVHDLRHVAIQAKAYERAAVTGPRKK